ncbi:MAG: response regulator [Flavobacteriaceae bacterium]|nr:response regulator [Flavobacteriaceae bacterium]
MKKYILCVDDEPINLRILNDLLEEKYDLEFAKDGKECLTKIENKTPDLLLLDVDLPDINGLKLCKQLKGQQSTSKLPIVLLSGHALPHHIKEGEKAGANRYVTKPYDIDLLEELIEELL